MLNSLSQVQTENNEIIKKVFFYDQLNKLRYLEEKIKEIQINIAAAKCNLLHPAILTKDEIDYFKTDFYGLKLAKVGVLT